MEIAAMFKLLRAMFSLSESMDHMHKSRVIACASYVMAWHSRALRSARNASTAHKANRTIEWLNLAENNIGDNGAVELAGAVKALLVMCASSGT